MFAAELIKLKDMLKILQQEYLVFVPAIDNEISRFVAMSNDTAIAVDENVLHSCKEHFFPQTEGLYNIKTCKNSVDIEQPEIKIEKRLIFGVRSCDIKGLKCLDKVFLTKGFTDTQYMAKRDNTVIIALSCNQPGENCFCTGMGVNPQLAEEADIQASIIGDKLWLEPKSSAGEKVIEQLQNILLEIDTEVTPPGEFSLGADMDGVTEKLKDMFDSNIWEDISRKCLNCGACTYICPTCHCFDISQDVRGEEGVKYRCWDSCMFQDYTVMAGGHNPRPGKKEKVRNRFMHKLRFFPERYNMLACTGCGRCINVCPVNLDITSVIKTIQEAKIDVQLR